MELNNQEIEIGHDEVGERIDALMDLAQQMSLDDSLTMSAAMEADAIMPDKNILSVYFGSGNKSEKHKLATESILSGIVESIKKAYDYVVSMIKKFIGWISSFFNGKGFTVEVSVISGIRGVLNDSYLASALSEVDSMVSQVAKGIGMEDIGFMAGHQPSIQISEVFENFKRSLNEHEVDFLTSGQRYKVIKDVVSEFTRGHYPDFVNGFSKELQDWVKDGLKEAPHIGRDQDVVSKFTAQRIRVINDIKHKYSSTIRGIDELEHKCVGYPPKGDHHLGVFQKQPSSLFPHIERIWQTVKFENISSEDKKLILSLEKVKKQFEADSKQITGMLQTRENGWPAENAVLKLAHSSNRDMLKYIATLVRVGAFIRTSANTAYQATMKSFTYITRLLHAIGKLPNIDRDRLHKCLEVINQKRRAIDSLTAIA